MNNENKKLTPIVCDVCGKRIVKGRLIYKKHGLTYACCSAECLLYATTNYYIEESTGYVETQDSQRRKLNVSREKFFV